MTRTMDAGAMKKNRRTEDQNWSTIRIVEDDVAGEKPRQGAHYKPPRVLRDNVVLMKSRDALGWRTIKSVSPRTSR